LAVLTTLPEQPKDRTHSIEN